MRVRAVAAFDQVLEVLARSLLTWTGMMTNPTFASPPLLASLREIAGEDDDFVREVVAIFLLETPGKLAALGAAIADDDIASVADVAHSLKGSAIAVDAEALRLLSESIEHAARRGTLGGAAERYSDIRGEFARIVAILEGESRPVR